LDFRFLDYGIVYSVKKLLDFVGNFVSAFNFILKMETAGSTEMFFPSINVHVVITRNKKRLWRR